MLQKPYVAMLKKVENKIQDPPPDPDPCQSLTSSSLTHTTYFD